VSDRPETLTEARARHGLGHRPAAFGRREVFEASTGSVVAEVCATGGWALVRGLDELRRARNLRGVQPAML
jgi:hypothetical protein